MIFVVFERVKRGTGVDDKRGQAVGTVGRSRDRSGWQKRTGCWHSAEQMLGLGRRDERGEEGGRTDEWVIGAKA